MATQTNLPTRTNTVPSSGYISDDDAVPTGDPGTTLGLLEERLQAWKHMCGYLEDYVKAVAKDEKSQAKDSEKILKSINSPLKEGHHFDQSLGGVAGLFENLRANTQARANLHLENEKNITGSVLPILERLHAEVKNKRKELDKGAGKTGKAVESARNSSQKHIELLGQHSATFDSSGGRVSANNDPYVLQRGVWHRLNKQIIEENNHRSDLITVQENFQQFEAHIIAVVQNALNTFNQFMAASSDREKAMYGDTAVTAQNINADFEWNGFAQRNNNVLVSRNTPPRNIDSVSFPNQNHRSTKPLIEGSLERKSRGVGALTGYKSGYYAVTPAGYLHEYKDNDNFRSDPNPETSLYLPDCVIGAVDGTKFTIKGKDSSGSKLSQKMSISSDYAFKAHTAHDAAQWHSIIATQTSGASGSLPTSPVDSRNITPVATNIDPAYAGDQKTGISSGPTSAAPMSATGAAPGYAPVGATPTSAGYAPTSAAPAAHTHSPTSATSAPGYGSAPGSAAPTGSVPTSATTTSPSAPRAPAAFQAAQNPAAGTQAYHTGAATNELEPRKY